jgi:O-methyltransferase involved in polyketide biosynthesis
VGAHGLSPPELATVEGRVLYESLRGVMGVSQALGGDSLERYLLARHRSIDRLLEAAIDSGTVSQVIEVACGLSARGLRFARRYGEAVEYIEADLPGMAARKRRALASIGTLGAHHRVVDLDALVDDGPLSLGALADGLDLDRGLAIVTEGLTGYLDGASLTGMWRRFAQVLHRYPAGRYLSDLHLGEMQDAPIWAFRLILSAFVRGRVHLHFDDATQARAALLEAGFDSAEIRPAAELAGQAGERAGGQRVHIIEASTV